QALDGPEALDLERARLETGEGKIHPHPPAHKAGDASDPHTEENLDKGLDETVPASDPASISPGPNSTLVHSWIGWSPSARKPGALFSLPFQAHAFPPCHAKTEHGTPELSR